MIVWRFCRGFISPASAAGRWQLPVARKPSNVAGAALEILVNPCREIPVQGWLLLCHNRSISGRRCSESPEAWRVPAHRLGMLYPIIANSSALRWHAPPPTTGHPRNSSTLPHKSSRNEMFSGAPALLLRANWQHCRGGHSAGQRSQYIRGIRGRAGKKDRPVT